MTTQYVCRTEERRGAVRAARDRRGRAILNGIDFLEVSATDSATLELHFIHPLPGQAQGVPSGPATPLTAENFVIEGGIRIRNLRVRSVEAAGDVLTVRVNTAGDFSIYMLRLVPSPGEDALPSGFDPALSEVEFSFKVACPSDFDCAIAARPSPHASAGLPINYLAKDYATFRQLMLDRLSVVMPAWRERTPADMQIALVELLAYVGDSLSYYQDAVATEAYLGTARKRISVRRHARLLDYAIHEGSNARAWVCLMVEKGTEADGATVPSGTQLLTGGGRAALVGHHGSTDTFDAEAPEVFETMHDATLHAELNTLRFHTWSDRECCLKKGATAATLQEGHARSSRAPSLLGKGDILLFEEVLGPATGLERDADPAKRWAVRLLHAIPLVDPLTNTEVLEIEWSQEDALPFPLCLSALVTDGSGRQTLIEPTVVRGNVLLADHGMTVRGEALVPTEVPQQGLYRPALAHGRLTFQGPVSTVSATATMEYDVRDARPVISLTGDGGVWSPQPDLLGSDPFGRDFVVETESDGVAHLRFGDGILGKRPAPRSRFSATYRRGGGTRGNVGAESIVRMAWTGSGVILVRNPIAAAGGRDPEALEQVRQFAPQAFRTQERAVTEADYAALAERNAEVQHAAGAFRWTGSWHTAFVTVDRKGGRDVDAPFKTRLREELERYRMVGYDVEVSSPVFVPLDLLLAICVKPGHFQSDVKRMLLDVFSSRDRGDGTLGFFHPDNFTFGQSLYLSQIYRTAMLVTGVASVNVIRFQRWGKEPNHELDKGVLTSAPLEILQLANDPSFPENGRLELMVAGGI